MYKTPETINLGSFILKDMFCLLQLLHLMQNQITMENTNW